MRNQTYWIRPSQKTPEQIEHHDAVVGSSFTKSKPVLVLIDGIKTIGVFYESTKTWAINGGIPYTWEPQYWMDIPNVLPEILPGKTINANHFCEHLNARSAAKNSNVRFRVHAPDDGIRIEAYLPYDPFVTTDLRQYLPALVLFIEELASEFSPASQCLLDGFWDCYGWSFRIKDNHQNILRNE